jgi:hypothetical protein
MMRNTLLGIILVTAGLVGCDNNDNAGGARVVPPPPRKKLPPCEEKVNAELQTAETPLAFKRVIEIGYQRDLPFGKYTLDQGVVRPALNLERGLTYYVTVNTTNLDKTTAYNLSVIYVPTCDEREQFQQLNPSYEEPIQLVATK